MLYGYALCQWNRHVQCMLRIMYSACYASCTVHVTHHVQCMLRIMYSACYASCTVHVTHHVQCMLRIMYSACYASCTVHVTHHVQCMLRIMYSACYASCTVHVTHHVQCMLRIMYSACYASCTVHVTHHVQCMLRIMYSACYASCTVHVTHLSMLIIPEAHHYFVLCHCGSSPRFRKRRYGATPRTRQILQQHMWNFVRRSWLEYIFPTITPHISSASPAVTYHTSITYKVCPFFQVRAAGRQQVQFTLTFCKTIA